MDRCITNLILSAILMFDLSYYALYEYRKYGDTVLSITTSLELILVGILININNDCLLMHIGFIGWRLTIMSIISSIVIIVSTFELGQFLRRKRGIR